MFTYPDYKGQLYHHRYWTYEGDTEANRTEDFAYKALRPPRHGETPTHRRINDGSAWVQRVI